YFFDCPDPITQTPAQSLWRRMQTPFRRIPMRERIRECITRWDGAQCSAGLHAISAQHMVKHTLQLGVPDSGLQHLGCHVGQKREAGLGESSGCASGPTTRGRIGCDPSLSDWPVSKTVNGTPVRKLTTPFVAHPSSSHLSGRASRPRAKGMSQLKLATKRCRTSKSALPLSPDGLKASWNPSSPCPTRESK